jgi:serine/threonine protein kinase
VTPKAAEPAAAKPAAAATPAAAVATETPPPDHKKRRRRKGPPLPPESSRVEDSPLKAAAASAFPKPPPSIATPAPPRVNASAPPVVPPMPVMPPVEKRPAVPPALSAAPADVAKLIAMVSPRRPFPTEVEQMIEVLETKKKHDHQKDFELITKLGQGAHAVVYHAIYKPTGANVALKSVFNSSDEEIDGEIELHRLLRPHQNCLDFYGRFKKASALWMVLELAEVGSPIDLLRLTRKPLMDGEIGVIVRDVVDALRFMHSLNAVHRDVKSDNMLLTKDAVVKLADFGASKSKSDSTGNRMNTLTGTPYFIAPEVLNTEAATRKGYDEKIDIWSLGISTIEMADGEPPAFDAHPMQVLALIAERPPPTAVTGTKRSGVFNAFVARCLVKDPAGRSTAAQLCADTFVVKAPPRSTLLPRISEFLEIVKKAGGRAAATTEWRNAQKAKATATTPKLTNSGGGAAPSKPSSSSSSSSKRDKDSKSSKKDKKTRSRAADAEMPTQSKLAQAPILAASESVAEAKQSLLAMSKNTPKSPVTVTDTRGRGATTTAAMVASPSSPTGDNSARSIKRSSSTSRLPTGGARRQTSTPFV